MPGFPVAACETSSYSRGTEQTSYQDGRVHLSEEEEIAAEESLASYCKPVELYNILRRRAIRNPIFLQRCLDYKIKVRQKKRIQMTAMLSDETQAVFPLYVCLARLAPKDEGAENCSAVYRIGRIVIFREPSEIDGDTQNEANFILPDVHKLAVTAGTGLVILLFFTPVEDPNSSSGANTSLAPLDPSSEELEDPNSSSGVNASMAPLDPSSNKSRDGEYCLYGKVSLEQIFQSWDKSPYLSLGLRAEVESTVDLHPCILKYGVQDKEQSISLQVPDNFENGFPESTPKQLQFKLYAEECGAKERSPYRATASAVASPSFSRIIRLKEGNIKFNYRYYNNKLQRTEVTEDFSCPICLVGCGSYKGLKYHLLSSHDLFNFEFSAWEDCPTINVSVKTDSWKSEIVAGGVDPKLQTFIFCAKPLKRIKREDDSSEKAKDADPLVLEPEIPAGNTELLENAGGVSNAIIQSHPEPDCVPPIAENDLASLAALQDATTPIHVYDPRMVAMLSKRQFYHSHKAQPMALEEVLSEEDSEDDADDEVADIEDRRMLGNFVDVSDEEKDFMHMWNSFIRRQRVLADGHIPWACEAFVKVHGHELLQSPTLTWCWRLYTIKLWNHGLLDARTINACSILLEQIQRQKSD